MRDHVWAGLAGAFVFFTALAILRSPYVAAQGDPPVLNLLWLLVGAPIFVYLSVLVRLRATREARKRWQQVPARTRFAIMAVTIALLVAVNATGFIIAKRNADHLEALFDCTPAAVDAGTMAVDFQGPGTSMDPTGLIDPPPPGDREARSKAQPAAAFNGMKARGEWRMPVERVTLLVLQDGEWFHGNTVDRPGSGQDLTFYLTEGPFDALRWEVVLQEPAAKDMSVSIQWEATRC